MSVVNITNARQNLYQLVRDVNSSSEPVLIYNNNGKNDWNAIQETLYLQSVPDMTESIKKAADEPIEEFTPYDPEDEW